MCATERTRRLTRSAGATYLEGLLEYFSALTCTFLKSRMTGQLHILYSTRSSALNLRTRLFRSIVGRPTLSRFLVDCAMLVEGNRSGGEEVEKELCEKLRRELRTLLETRGDRRGNELFSRASRGAAERKVFSKCSVMTHLNASNSSYMIPHLVCHTAHGR